MESLLDYRGYICDIQENGRPTCRFQTVAARNNWVINYAAYNMLVNLSGLVGYTGSHVLGNFSVSKMRGEQGTGFSAKLKDLTEGIKAYQVVLESGGQVIPGGRAPFAMAAKRLWDANTPSVSRRWLVPRPEVAAGSGTALGRAIRCWRGLLWSVTGGQFYRVTVLGCGCTPEVVMAKISGAPLR